MPTTRRTTMKQQHQRRGSRRCLPSTASALLMVIAAALLASQHQHHHPPASLSVSAYVVSPPTIATSRIVTPRCQSPPKIRCTPTRHAATTTTATRRWRPRATTPLRVSLVDATSDATASSPAADAEKKDVDGSSGAPAVHHHDQQQPQQQSILQVDTHAQQQMPPVEHALLTATSDDEDITASPPPPTADIHATTVSDHVEDTATSLESVIGMESPALQFPELDLDERTVKILNALLLVVSFGYAAYTIFNIDHGMTRGWTQSEIAMRIPLDNWNHYESSLAEKPIYTKTLINVVIYLLGDWLSQTVFQQKNVLDFDARRTLRNGFIGLCFGPLVHEYYQFSDQILPVEGGLMNRIEKILMDQSIYLTIKCSLYIAAVGLLQGDSIATVKTSVKDKIGGIVITAWKFWPLIHCLTYSIIPARHRILWVNMVDLVWNAILASMSNSPDPPPPEMDDESGENAKDGEEREGRADGGAQQMAAIGLTSSSPDLLSASAAAGNATNRGVI